MTLVHFPEPDPFLMGTPRQQTGWQEDELLHRRRIGRSLALASKKVTVRQFKVFLQALKVENPYLQSNSPDPDSPIVSVTWYEAAQYCRWLSEVEGLPENEMVYPASAEIEKCKDGQTPLKLPPDHLSRKGYRLPTEAEWEYACRAGTTTAHFYGGGGEDLLAEHVWYHKNSQERTWPVGQKRPNDFGLFDMHGNTWDWCQESYWNYAVGPQGYATDEEDKREITDRTTRVLRGSSFLYPPSTARSAFRLDNRPTYRSNTHGLRVARTL